MNLEEATVRKNCETCGAEFISTELLLNGVPKLQARFCDVCAAARISDKENENKRAREAFQRQQWASLCPPAFLETDPKRLPLPEKLDEVLKWSFGTRGLVLHGPTGLGKSRCAWKLLEREFFKGRRILVVNSFFLGVKLPALMGRSMSDTEDCITDLVETDLLFLDDPFKIKVTDRCEELLFTIINQRTEALKPCITTLNDTGETLAVRLSEDRGMPMIRRIRESSESITFRKKDTK